MKILKKIFSVSNDGMYKVITILGIKLKFYNTKKAINNLQNQRNDSTVGYLYKMVRTLWYEGEHIEEFFAFSRLLYNSPHVWKTIFYHFWLFMLSAFVQKGYIVDAKKILDNYLYFHQIKGLDEYFYTAQIAKECGISNSKIEDTLFILDNIKNEERLDAFKNYFKGKTIAVVGASGRELGQNKGNEIDAHDIVIRFNNYPLEEKYVCDYGKKTNVWVRQTTPGVIHKPDISGYDYVVWAENRDVLWLRPQGKEIFYNYLKNAPEKIINIPQNYFYDLKRESHLFHPTTGAVVVYMLYQILGTLKNVDAYGFAFLDNNSEDADHFFDGLCDLKTGHYFDREVEFMNKFYYNYHK